MTVCSVMGEKDCPHAMSIVRSRCVLWLVLGHGLWDPSVGVFCDSTPRQQRIHTKFHTTFHTKFHTPVDWNFSHQVSHQMSTSDFSADKVSLSFLAFWRIELVC